MSHSVDIARKVVARLARNTTVSMTCRVSFWSGIVLMRTIPAMQNAQEMRYQRLRDRVVSATGAQKNFQIWGTKLHATMAAPSATVRPRRVAKNAIAVAVNPATAPNGTM